MEIHYGEKARKRGKERTGTTRSGDGRKQRRKDLNWILKQIVDRRRRRCRIGTSTVSLGCSFDISFPSSKNIGFVRIARTRKNRKERILQ